MTEPIEPAQPGSARPGDNRAAPFVLPDPLTRFDARVLDPTTAARQPGGAAPATTVYVGDTLLVTATDPDDARQLLGLLDEAVRASGLPIGQLRPERFDPFETIDDPDHDARARLLRLAADRKLPLVFPVRFAPTTEGPVAAVDVWPLLQRIRYAGRSEAGDEQATRLSRAVGLNHLMSAAAVIGGNPYSKGMAAVFGNPYSKGMATIGGNPYSKGMAGGVASYSAAGSGGRGPVSVVLPAPLRSASAGSARVVVLDTGVGRHPWFDAQNVDAGLQFVDPLNPADPPISIGKNPTDPDNALSDPEGAGAIPDPMVGMLDTHSGHGTFIAGLLRQTCPDADITAVRIMDSDGIVPELALTDALIGVGIVQVDNAPYIDALVLSLGYYAETADDVEYTAGLRHLVLSLAEHGVAIFCAAGNDSTTRRSYPAAFADDPQFTDEAHLPMASVAALNPDLSVALFSNDGEWVLAEAPGANVVSTAPTAAQGSWNQDTAFAGPGSTIRGTIDPDSFSGGFCTWSGTSFAAPVLAGWYLARLIEKKADRTIESRKHLVGLGRTQVEAASPGTDGPG